jgi:hypothetical protein
MVAENDGDDFLASNHFARRAGQFLNASKINFGFCFVFGVL